MLRLREEERQKKEVEKQMREEERSQKMAEKEEIRKQRELEREEEKKVIHFQHKYHSTHPYGGEVNRPGLAWVLLRANSAPGVCV